MPTPPVIGISGRLDRSHKPPNAPLTAVASSYVRAVTLSGGACLVIPPRLTDEALHATVEALNGLLLSGGGDVATHYYGAQDSGLLSSIDEERDRMEVSLARWALKADIPILGICRGCQVLNVAAGGTLIQDLPSMTKSSIAHSHVASRPMDQVAHTVEIEDGSRLSDVFAPGELAVNSAHHQAIDVPGAGLSIVARAPDGIIEGIEKPEHPFYIGVQWHPEAMLDSHPAMRRLFEALVQAAAMSWPAMYATRPRPTAS